MKESEAWDRLQDAHGVVNSIRLMGYAMQRDMKGEEWLREKVSRQQIAKIRADFAEARVPWELGAIEWGAALNALKRANDAARAALVAAQAQKEARAARRGLRGGRPA